jgi:fucose permease
MTVFALLGANALLLLFVWLISAIAASYLSERKGYGEKAGLVTGMLLSAVGLVIWLIWPARRNSRWKLQGAFGRGDGKTVAQLRSEQEGGGS